MAKTILIIGESGSGKTTSMRNLDPASTFYIDCDKKGLSWKGWREQYNMDAGNYLKTDVPANVLHRLQWLNGDLKSESGEQLSGGLKYKTVIVDTLNGIMVAEEMRIHKADKKESRNGWYDLAEYVYDIIDYALTMRDDVTVIFVAHSETISDDNGIVFTRMKTNGRKLDKIVLESKFTTVLLADTKDGKHIFQTHANQSTAKTPLGAFEEDEIDNDITVVLEALKDF